MWATIVRIATNAKREHKKFEYTKEVIRRRESKKERKYNG
jgi:cytidylate kinase